MMPDHKIVISVYYKDPNYDSRAVVCKDIVEGGLFIEYVNKTGDVIRTEPCPSMSIDQVESKAEDWALDPVT